MKNIKQIALSFILPAIFSLASCNGEKENIRTETFTITADYGKHENGMVTLLMDDGDTKCCLPDEINDYEIDYLFVGGKLNIEYDFDLGWFYITNITVTHAETAEFEVAANSGGVKALRREGEDDAKHYAVVNVINQDRTFECYEDLPYGTKLLGVLRGNELASLYSYPNYSVEEPL